jgi:ribonucleotide monophosphatase NagD (HAD superfamily)
MALDAGMASAVVLTGETTAEAIADEPVSNKPTYVLERVDQLIPQHLWEEFGWVRDEE